MVDVHDKATRSKNMRAIGTRDTAIEKRLAGLLAGAGFSFTVQDAALPGTARILSWRTISALSLPTAASGIIMIAICSRFPPQEPRSGWIK